MPFVLGPDTYEPLTENGLKRRNPVKIELSGATMGDILSAQKRIEFFKKIIKRNGQFSESIIWSI